MADGNMDRREFHQLTLAALGGVITGTTAGCNNGGTTAPTKSTSASPAASPASGAGSNAGAITLTAAAEALIMDDPNTCRGLNSCKGKGRDKENACAGQGTCASVADASCGGQNACKGQGGCGSNPGMNDCKGQGGCHVPLMDSAWTTARAAFETAMKKNGKPFGDAPAKKK